MKYHKQLFKHDPDNGVIGDCQRTAIACILNLDVEEVPHFGEKHWLDTVAFNKAIDDWLELRNLACVNSCYDCSLETVLEWQNNNPNCYYMLVGESGNGTNHVVIGRGDKIIHDPAIDCSGIVGPDNQGLYWVTHLVPMEY